MPMTIYTQNQNHPVMMNTGLSRTPESPGSLSQATTALPSPSTNDLANNVNSPVPGWPKLAKIIAKIPDLEAFASFTDLNIKSLLYYQAELIYLRKALHKAEYVDYRQSSEEDASLFAEDLTFLIEARDESIQNQELPPKQWIIIEKIRTTLEKYNAALLQFSKVAALREANSCNIRTLGGCVKKVTKDGTALTGDGAFTWGDFRKASAEEKPLVELFWGLFIGFFVSPDDERKPTPNEFQEHLIAPHKGKKPDGLTQWVIQRFIPFYNQLRNKYLVSLRHKLFPVKQSRTDVEKSSSVSSSAPPNSTDTLEKSVTGNLTAYSGAWIVRITSIMTTIVACLLPVVAITVLAWVRSMGLILGLIALFTAIFAFGLVLLSSSSSRVEIFTATAAFSAVMVVFVQNQINPQ